MIPSTVYIGIGSNLGIREQAIADALAKISSDSAIQIKTVSQAITTKPCGGPPNQPEFLNAAAEISTTLTPETLLKRLQTIENELGRTRDQHWGPRTIDLDILLFADRIIETEQLNVPHPRLHTRRFALQPLAQIAPDALHPQLNQTIQQLLDKLDIGVKLEDK
jgi:2-amino-4-hydroxy-6-hydroxymethyldihydropteridine diphosphokinase